MTKTTDFMTVAQQILNQNQQLLDMLKNVSGTAATEHIKTKKPSAKTKKPSAKQVTLTSAQLRVVNGVINRAKKHGYTLTYYVSGTWVWFENVNANKTYTTRKGETRYKDTSETFAELNLSTKNTIVEYSEKRGQYVIKNFLPETK